MLKAKNLYVSFAEKNLFEGLSLSAERGQILAIIGPNGSGKSTLLRTLAKNITPKTGSIILDGKELESYSTRELAATMAFLPQTPGVPTDLTVRELIGYGRFPYQKWWKNTSLLDKEVVEWAIRATGLAILADRLVATLSGGERQRVWLAMALAQQPRVLLLDEPTTYLDISHQLEILSLIQRLNKTEGITVIMVLHEINHAARYADRVAVMKEGCLFTVGEASSVITKDMLREVFRVQADVWLDEGACPVCIPKGLISED